MHERYEQLCALAATGQITGDAMAVLDVHVKECAECRSFLGDLMPIKAQVAPLVAGSHARTFDPPEGIRERFLQRAAEAGLQLHREAAIAVPERVAAPPRPEHAGVLSRVLTSFRSAISPWYENPLRFAMPVAAAAMCGVFGFFIAQHRYESLPTPTTIANTPTVTTVVQTPIVPKTETQASKSVEQSEQLAQAQREGDEARKRLDAALVELESVRKERQDLLQQVSAIAQSASANEKFELLFKSTTHRLQEADVRISQLKSELESERQRTAASDAVLLAQQKVAEDANARVSLLQAKLEQQSEFASSKGMAGDLIAARNLHIVDVYDSESSGARKRAFGRVFYVEGKSLVFYAYDLPANKNNKKIEFRVWGEQAGVKSVSIGLGSMQNDNATQGRWVLACNDPKVLSRINAIYITADPSARPSKEPQGSKMMYAFLGSPNHP